MKESRIVNIISILVLISVFSLNTEAQDYYSSKEYVEYNNVRYRVTHYPGSVYVGNTANHMREVPRHKVGSGPTVYYTYASGMGHMATSDAVQFKKIVRDVFSDDEINTYAKSQGSVFLTYVVDPDSGKVLEVSFRIGINNGDKTLLAIPIEKFYKLEVLIKQRLVCHISEALKAEKQSYALSGDTLFSDGRRHRSSVDGLLL